MSKPAFKSPGRFLLLVATTLLSFTAWPAAAAEPGGGAADEFLSDRPDLIVAATQDWGELGWDTAAHAAGQAGAPLQIAETHFTKGLGHHAKGSLLILLDGAYTAFKAEVGLQPCAGGGSVVFRVVVDGAVRFDSGRMVATNAPRPVQVELAGAQELRLETADANDDITCDMANWANARLTPAPAAAVRRPPAERVDIAPFGRVVTWDPNRRDGARANRLEAFRADDLFLDTDLPADAKGRRRVPLSTNHLACVGLQWLNRRALAELGLAFVEPAQVPPAAAVRVEGWFGESAWQGAWQPLAGEVQAESDRLVFHLSPKAGLPQTQKVRWVFPAATPPLVSAVTALTRSRWETVKLCVQVEPTGGRGRASFRVINGELLSGEATSKAASAADWQRLAFSRAQSLVIRSSRPSSFKWDPTVLQFRLPTGGFGVAVEDVLSNACVYLPEHGLFLTTDPAPVTLPEYRARIAGQKTVLAQVQELPEQTLEQALAKTHHSAQSAGPVMLSLACDNHKFVLERDGTVRFPTVSNPSGDWFASAAWLRPRFGGVEPGQCLRGLAGGWLPIPILTATAAGVEYRQVTFVASVDEAGSNPVRLNRRSLGVVQFELTNTLAQPAAIAAALTFNANATAQPIPFHRHAAGFVVGDEGRPLAQVLLPQAGLEAEPASSELNVRGVLPPHGSAAFTVLIPTPGSGLPAQPEPDRWRAETGAYWQAALAPATQITTPEPLLNDLIRSSQVRCLIAARNEAEGARVAPWIAAMSYGPLESEAHSVIRGMDFLGHADFARRSLDYFICRYNTNGFLTTGYTTFGTAWHLWTLGEHYRLYRDADWLQPAAPELARVGRWIVEQTRMTRCAQGSTAESRPEAGLMPPGVLADWNAFAYHYALNAYYYAALREIGTALLDLAKSRAKSGPGSIDTREAAPFLNEAEALRGSVLRAYRWTQAQAPALPLRNGTWIPHYPSQVHSPGKLADFFPGQDAGRSWCYDVELGAHQLVATGVFEPHDPEVDRLLAHMEDVQFLADGWFDYSAAQNQADWFNLGGFSKVQPYYTRNAEIYALRDEVKPFIRSYFNTLAAMLNPEVLTFWEHFHHSGAWDKTHETGYFLHQTRTLLVTERGAELWLAPFVPRAWLANGRRVEVRQAPTRFGPVGYALESHLAEGYVQASVTPPARQAPARLVLRLRHPEGKPITEVRLNGKRYRHFDSETVWLTPKTATGPVDLQVLFR